MTPKHQQLVDAILLDAAADQRTGLEVLAALWKARGRAANRTAT
jgi:hypothetical protein